MTLLSEHCAEYCKKDMASNVDCSGGSRAVWLVKVPKYLSRAWSHEDNPSGIVGSLHISKNPQKNEVLFNLSETLAVGEDSDEVKMPREFKMLLSKVNQSMAVLSEGPSASVKSEIKQEEKPEMRLAIEGVVVQRADCRPLHPSTEYMLLKKKSILNASKPKRQAIQVKNVVKYKPVSNQPSNQEYEKKKKEEGKRVRGEEDDVKAQLFAAFERHQYYNLKDLVRITQQPIVYLKSILKEIGHYNTKNPHKNMWELKPEYRHYSKDT